MSQEKISLQLQHLEEEYNINIFIAKDFGSKSWNVDTEKSDHDVGFVYLQPREHYVNIDNYRETIDRHIEFNGKEHTFQGWNLTRFLELYKKSNPTTIEFCASNKTYRKDNEIEQAWNNLEELAVQEFNPIATYYHYRKLAKNQYRRYIEQRVFDGVKDTSHRIVEKGEQNYRLEGEDGQWKLPKSSVDSKPIGSRYYLDRKEPTVKRYLYVLRAIMYQEYIRQTHAFPSLDLVEFIDQELQQLDVPESNKEEFKSMIHLKKTDQADKKVGNPSGQFIDHKISQTIDDEKHNTSGLPKEKVDQNVKQLLKNKENSESVY